MRREKNKSIEEKKCALVAKVFYGHAFLTDLIGHIPRTSKPSRKKSPWLDESAYFRASKP